MGEFKAFDGGEPFVQPDCPFLLIYENDEQDIRVVWFETEEDLMDCIYNITKCDCKIVNAIEIGSCREIDIKE